MLKVRRALTEIMLDVTNAEIYDIATEELTRAKRKAAKGTYQPATLIASAGLLGTLLTKCNVDHTLWRKQRTHNAILEQIRKCLTCSNYNCMENFRELVNVSSLSTSKRHCIKDTLVNVVTLIISTFLALI